MFVPQRGSPDLRRRLAGGVVVGLGAVFGGVEVLHLFTMETPVGRVVEAVLPLTGALALVAAGVALWTGRFAGVTPLRITVWTLLGAAVMASLFGWVLAHQYVRGGEFHHPWFVLVNNLIAGSLLGLVLGVYDARSHAHRRVAEAKRSTVAGERAKLAFVNRELRHHVLNGMNVVLGTAELLEEHVEGEAETHLGRIVDRGDKIVDRVQNVRTLAQALTGDLNDDVRACDIREVLQEQLVAARARYEEATFTLDASPDVSVYAGANLGEVIESLVSNAVEHNDAATPHVTVAVETNGDTVEVRVADNGPGVGPEVENALENWEPSSPTGGVGMGLALVNALVQHYDGEVWFEDADSGGTVAVVALARAD